MGSQGAGFCLEAGAKVLKLPYPGTADSCAAITKRCGDVPWSVLSAGVAADDNHAARVRPCRINRPRCSTSAVISAASRSKDGLRR